MFGNFIWVHTASFYLCYLRRIEQGQNDPGVHPSGSSERSSPNALVEEVRKEIKKEIRREMAGRDKRIKDLEERVSLLENLLENMLIDNMIDQKEKSSRKEMRSEERSNAVSCKGIGRIQ